MDCKEKRDGVYPSLSLFGAPRGNRPPASLHLQATSSAPRSVAFGPLAIRLSTGQSHVRQRPRVEALARFVLQIVAGLISGCPSLSWLASTVRFPLITKNNIDTRKGVYIIWCAKGESTAYFAFACTLRPHKPFAACSDHSLLESSPDFLVNARARRVRFP